MTECKNRFKISIINLNKRLNKLKKFNKKIDSNFKSCKDVYLIQKWSGRKNSEILSTEKM